MTKSKIVIVFGLVEFLFLIFGTGKVMASTEIRDQFINTNTYWGKEGSPYILYGNNTVTDGAVLTIGDGVEIKGVSLDGRNVALNVVGAGLNINGKPKSRVKISDINSIYVDYGNALMQNTDISVPMYSDGIESINSVIKIASSTIIGSNQNPSIGILVKDSVVDVWGSYIKGHKEGFKILPDRVQLMSDHKEENIGGIGNVLDFGIMATSSDVKITNSSLASSTVAITNLDTRIVNARNNWWGKIDGPSTSDFGRSRNITEYDPWLKNEPEIDQGAKCCSSVIFIPGIQASQLFTVKNSLIGNSTTTTGLWEPYHANDVKKLFMSKDGNSIDGNIFAGEPITEAYGFKGIYDQFTKFMNTLVSNDIMNEWKSYGYDWRQSITEVVAGQTKRSTSTENLINTIEQMAKNSRTGQVTIIAHSNGGLVAKYLTKILSDNNKSDLMEKVITVGTPFLGTPKAILSLLHGYDQSLWKGLVLNEGLAREFALNMPGAYSLLPSKTYFMNVFGPTIAFASTSMEGLNSGQYSQKIETADEQNSFVVDSKNSRNISTSSPVGEPLEGNDTIMNFAVALHNIIDSFVWPSGIIRTALVGIGEYTPIGLEYNYKQDCSLISKVFGCKNKLTYKPIKNNNGDGTVVGDSAVYDMQNVISLNLPLISKKENSDFNHANMLESSTTLSVIKSIITNGGQNSFVETNNGVSSGYVQNQSNKSLVLSTHSPVELHVYDKQGNHTGLINQPPGVEEGLFKSYEERIPGSQFESIGEINSPETYITLPENNDEQYVIEIKGLDTGLFTYEIELKENGTTLDRITYSNIPVTAVTEASTTIDGQDIFGYADNLSSTTQSLNIDVDGNGVADIVTDVNVSNYESKFFENMIKTLQNLKGDKARIDKLLARINKVESLYKNGTLKPKYHNIPKNDSLYTEKFHNNKHYSAYRLSAEQKAKIIDSIDDAIAKFE